MSAVSKVILVGNLGRDPELRYTNKGNAVLSFSLATNRGVKQQSGEYKQETTWHRATLWGKRAESCAKYLKKGNRVYVEGILQSRTWQDKQGNSRKNAEILVEDIHFLGAGTRAPESGEKAEVHEVETPDLEQ